MRSRPGAALALAWLLFGLSGSALEWTQIEGAARALPVMRDQAGRRLADGEFAQWVEGDRLHARTTYVFSPDRRAEETSVFRQRPELAQDSWSWKETRNGRPYRDFSVDFASGRAAAAVYQDEPMQSSDTLKMIQGRTFAGFGFTLAIKALRAPLMRGDRPTLQAVAFMPKPRIVPVDVSYAGREQVRMAEHTAAADHFAIHPRVPSIARLFVKVIDPQIWLTAESAEFARWEGPMVATTDPVIRVDLPHP